MIGTFHVSNVRGLKPIQADNLESLENKTETEQTMAHNYNTRLNKSRDENKDMDDPHEPSKITGYLWPLELEYDKEKVTKKARKDVSSKINDDMDMNFTDKLLSASDTGLSSDSSQAKESWKEKRLKKISMTPATTVNPYRGLKTQIQNIPPIRKANMSV